MDNQDTLPVDLANDSLKLLKYFIEIDDSATRLQIIEYVRDLALKFSGPLIGG